MRSYAIGDIHGYLSELERAHDLIARDRAGVDDDEAPIVHVGDLTDRGPNSRGVVQFLMEGVAEGQNWVVLKGNHDRMYAHYLRETEARDPLRDDLYWLDPPLGGMETLRSYDVDPASRDIHTEARARVPQAHRDFMEARPTTYRRGDCFFCHAGIRPGVPLDEQAEDDLVWIRRDFHISREDHGALIVHGHTPVDEATHYGNRINIDTGAGFGRPISPIVIEGREAWLLTEQGRTPLARDD